MSKLVVFVCTGNICRSPMAEYLFRARVASCSDFKTCSAGLMTGYGVPASRYAVMVLGDMGVDASAHRSQPMTPDLVKNADLIVVMTGQHRDALLAHHPEAAAKISLLKSFNPDAEGENVMDPIGLSLDVYRFVCEEIAAAVRCLSSHLLNSAAVREDE